MGKKTASAVGLATILGCGAHAPTYSGTPRLQVVARSVIGEPLPGAALILCPLADDQPDYLTTETWKGADCTTRLTDATGLAVFDSIKVGRYAISAHLSGFATTVVLPLSIAAADPLAPDRVVMVLNGVCFDCRDPRTKPN